MEKFYFNGTELTPETILATRKHFYDICMGCIKEAKSGEVFVNNLEKYISSQLEKSERYMTGGGDRTFTFLQRAYWIQTGEMLPLFS